MPVGERRVRIAGLHLDGMPQRQDLVGKVEPQLLEPWDGAQPRVAEDERASRASHRCPVSMASEVTALEPA